MKPLKTSFVVLGLVLASYALSPFVALAQMKYHLDHKHGVEFSEFVDFEKVRENLRVQMLQKVPSPDPSNPWGALGYSMALVLIEPMLRNMVSPEFIAKQVSSSTGSASHNTYSFSYVNLDCVKVQVNQKAEATLRRYGLFSWKITELVIKD